VTTSRPADYDPAADELSHALLDALPGRRAVLDHAGRIRVANRAWLDRRFQETTPPLWLGVGDSLLELMQNRAGFAPGLAQAMADLAEAMQRVLARDVTSIELEIPGLDDPRRWERVEIVALSGGGALFSVDDITDLVLADQRNARLATHDTLTGLPNRALLRDRVEQAIARSARGMVAVLHIDLDRFSALNASLGPRRADQVLVLVGERLRRAVGRGDTVARAGDDSFVVLTETSGGLPEIMAVAEHLADCVVDPIKADGG